MSNAWIFCCSFGFTFLFFSLSTFFSNGSMKYAFHRLIARFFEGDFNLSFFTLLTLRDLDRSFLSVSTLSIFSYGLSFSEMWLLAVLIVCGLYKFCGLYEWCRVCVWFFDKEDIVYLSCVLFGVFVSFFRFFESRLDRSLRLLVLIR